ncbi:unnamed protein product [Caenorhabditis sp. 36 PRJEB53466]|nr:unnamed protein product [Caenorhabditis sp. 36 PRJEB53466]
MAATAAKKPAYEFTIDDDELNDEGKQDQATMCNYYKVNLPASASILSKQIAKSQAKRAKKDERSRRRVDLSTVREQDETKLSASDEHASPLPSRLDDVPSAPPSQFGGRSRIDSAPIDVKLKRQASLPEEERKAEPMDEEEAQLLAMLLSGIEHNGNGVENIWKEAADRKFSLNGNLPNLPNLSSPQIPLTIPSPGLPRMPPSAKVSEWLLERSTSPDNVSVVSSVLLEDGGFLVSYPGEEDDDVDVFFDAEEESKVDIVNGLEHEMQGLSLNRNIAAMTQSMVRVEEETTTDGPGGEIMNGRSGRSNSVSPRPTNDQFMRNSNGSATFNVKHSSTLARVQKFTPPTINGNMTVSATTTTATPLSSRTTRSVLRVHNVNSMNNSTPRPMQAMTMSKTDGRVNANTPNRRAVSGIRQPEALSTITPPQKTQRQPPTVTINPSTPSRPASAASSAGRSSVQPAANLEGLQYLIHAQEEALRRAALDGQATERKLSWQSDHEANRQSTSTHSSLGSLCSSKSIDGAHALSKLGTPASRIPTPRSRLPTPRGSNLPKRVHSVAAAVRFTTSKPESAVATAPNHPVQPVVEWLEVFWWNPMDNTPLRRTKSADLDDPFTPIPQISRLRTPRTSREFICPLRSSPSATENVPPDSRKVSPARKRGIEDSSVTPLHRKTGPPLLKKKSSMSLLADGFRTAASLTNEGESEQDPFGLNFRNESVLRSARKIEMETKRKEDETFVIDPKKCLPDKYMEMYKKMKKLDKFYDWQQECLADERLLAGQNCILSLPTGAGKTLIAEILMLREAIVHKRNAILVLPYVAIVQEKISSLAPFEEKFGINIEEYASNKGRFPPIKRRKRVSVYVATIEKANMLINSLITQGQIDRIGLVVVDELHMIGDGGRGAILEQLLAKFLFKGSGQIVGMSATLPNIDDLKSAMRAFVYSTNFRPVELTEFVKIGQVMHQVAADGELNPAGDLPPNQLKSTDPDGICQLLVKLIPKSSAVIFCPNKKNCENVAVLIAKSLPPQIRQMKRADTETFLQSYLADNDDERMDSVLKQCLLSGVAYHHSGLTQDERKCVESAFMEGLIYVVCATSTLAAGVNLPVRRVIIKAPMVGRERLGKAQYLQMAGRAGRAGFDTKGDCITIVKPGEEERWFRAMLKSEIPRCMSSLSTKHAMSSFILDIVSLKVAKSSEEILTAVRYSLFAAQEAFEKIKELVDRSIKILEEQTFIEIDEIGAITATELGSAVFNAGFAPEEATRLHEDLLSSLNQGVIFSSHFHLLFIITPYEQACNINWDLFLLMYNSLPKSEKKLLGECGLQEKFILEAIITRVELTAGTPRMRLYIALMLQKIWSHEPMFAVAERFGVEKGWLQTTLQSSISQAASIAKFSEKINTMWPLRKLLPELVQRLSEAAQPELLPLMQVDGVKKARAAVLFKAGYKTVGMIARANPNKIVQELGTIRLAQANAIIASAKMVLRDQVDEKMEELDAWGVAEDDFAF